MSAALETVTLNFRPMGYADLKEVMAIEVNAYHFPWTEAIMRDCIRVGYCCLVVESQGRIEGYGIMSVAAGECHILNLCIRPPSQGRGLARCMLEHLLELARVAGAQTAFLEVRPSNPRAIGIYQTAGFCEVGLRRGYYPAEGGREDALVMAKAL